MNTAPVDKFYFAVELWREYYVTTENHDRGVCTRMRKGIAIPATAGERELCNQFAKAALRRTEEKLRDAGVSWGDVQRAREWILKHETGV